MLRIEQYGDVTRVHMTTWRGRLVGYDVSAYLTRDVLVDTGFAHVSGDFSRFLDVTKVRGVIVTHWHEDHAGNAALTAARGVPLAIAPETLAQLAGSAAASVRFYRRFVWGVAPPVRSPVSPFDNEELRTIHAPGHTADHYVVWDADRSTLFSGDLFLGVKVRATFPDEEPRQLITTIRRVAAMRPERMFDAHRGLVRDPTNALLAKADWLDETIAQMDKRIDDGWSDRAIRDDVLGRENAVGAISGGEYSKLTMVRAVRRTRATGGS
jgi:ribonuclease/clavin/mitogillin